LKKGNGGRHDVYHRAVQEHEEMDRLDIENWEKSLVPRPYPRRVYRLKDLVKRMTPRNVHTEIDFGELVGREAL
jgi:antitoxin component of MazEF toxin-antitoxin module